MTDPWTKRVVICDATLYLGDCLEILPTLGKIDAVVTDPPYGIGAGNYKRGGTKYGQSKARAKVYEPLEWDEKPADDAIRLVISVTTYAIVFGGNYYDLPPSPCWLVWDKQNGEGSGYADCELAWTNLNKAVRRIYWRWAGMLQKHMGHKKEERVHPTQKPVGVMEWCINHLPEGCGTIIDPFMGSGTTGVACAKLGRKFIGIEMEPKYFDIACKRIQKAYDQPDMFIEPPVKAIQEELL